MRDVDPVGHGDVDHPVVGRDGQRAVGGQPLGEAGQGTVDGLELVPHCQDAAAVDVADLVEVTPVEIG